jgi:hypothetical protein
LWRGDNVSVRQLREDFAQYLYLPKLSSAHLLQQAIESGLSLATWQKDAFAFADSYDEENTRYRGLRAGNPVLISLDGYGLLVKSDIAEGQLQTEIQEKEIQLDKVKADPPIYGEKSISSEKLGTEKADLPPIKRTRFFGHIETDGLRFFRCTDDIEKEILKHLHAQSDGSIKITIHIEAKNPDGFNQDTERTLRENGRTLGFGNIEFD